MQLRPYQQDIHNSLVDFLHSDVDHAGQVWAPMGAGKTVSFIRAIEYAINVIGMKSVCVVYPRINLAQEQARRISNAIGRLSTMSNTQQGNHIADISFFHSGAPISGVTVASSTDVESLMTSIDRTIKLGKAHITISVIDSYAEKLVDTEFDLLIIDEAHNFTTKKLAQKVEQMKFKKRIMFTATPVAASGVNEETSDDVQCSLMFNDKIFGKQLHKVHARGLIADGYILAPLIKYLECEVKDPERPADIIEISAQSYIDQWDQGEANGLP